MRSVLAFVVVAAAAACVAASPKAQFTSPTQSRLGQPCGLQPPSFCGGDLTCAYPHVNEVHLMRGPVCLYVADYGNTCGTGNSVDGPACRGPGLYCNAAKGLTGRPCTYILPFNNLCNLDYLSVDFCGGRYLCYTTPEDVPNFTAYCNLLVGEGEGCSYADGVMCRRGLDCVNLEISGDEFLPSGTCLPRAHRSNSTLILGAMEDYATNPATYPNGTMASSAMSTQSAGTGGKQKHNL